MLPVIDVVRPCSSRSERLPTRRSISKKLTYYLIPVHPSDRPLQAMEWKGCVYMDPMLPFGLRSAPKMLADGLEWHRQNCSIRHACHSLDDFIIVALPHSSEGAKPQAIITRPCASLGVPLAKHKRDGPTTCFTFPGIEQLPPVGQIASTLGPLRGLERQ